MGPHRGALGVCGILSFLHVGGGEGVRGVIGVVP